MSYYNPNRYSDTYKDGERNFLLQRINRDQHNPEGGEEKENYVKEVPNDQAERD